MKPEQERVKTVLIDTVALLCKNGLTYERELKIEAVIGVTVDQNDLFLVHINETFTPQGGASSSASTAATAESLAVVPFSTHSGQQTVKREFESTRTPTSGAKRMKVESMSPAADLAKQQLRFPSPAKGLPASVPGSPGLMSGVTTMLRPDSAVRRGMTVSGRRAAARVARGRGGTRPRGFMAGRPVRGGRGLPGVAQMSARPMARGMLHRRGQRLPSLNGKQLPSSSSSPRLLTGYDMKFTPPSSIISATAVQTSSSRITPSSVPADSSIRFSYSPYHAPTMPSFTPGSSACGDGLSSSSSSAGNMSAFSTSDPNRFVNTVPPGFGFDSIFSSDSNSAQMTSFADISPSIDFGFQPDYTSPPSGNSGFARSASGVQNVKRESMDDDVIYVDDDTEASGSGVASASALAGQEMFEGSTDIAESSGDGAAAAAVQQITRRVTITTNIQGQNVKYEQVCVFGLPRVWTILRLCQL